MCIYEILRKRKFTKIKETQVKRSYLNVKGVISENIVVDS